MMKNENMELLEAIGLTILYSPVTAVLIIYFSSALLCVGSLFVFHLYLISLNLTTYEHV